MRPNNTHAKAKLLAMEGYINRFITSMCSRGWRELYFIDLFAGPGKNRFGNDEVLLGSPLVALTARDSFTKYRFAEIDPGNCATLSRRVDSSERRDHVKIFQGDCNEVVNEIVREIIKTDSVFVEGLWSSLSLAILDPEGLELRWDTVEKLGRMNRMDLIINFSTSGITRNARKFLNTGNTEKIDRFFGTTDWQAAYREAGGDKTRVRRALLDLYKSGLENRGYEVAEPPASDELVFKNKRNVQLYTLIGASKHQLGVEFWRDAISKIGPSGQLGMF